MWYLFSCKLKSKGLYLWLSVKSSWGQGLKKFCIALCCFVAQLLSLHCRHMLTGDCQHTGVSPLRCLKAFYKKIAQLPPQADSDLNEELKAGLRVCTASLTRGPVSPGRFHPAPAPPWTPGQGACIFEESSLLGRVGGLVGQPSFPGCFCHFSQRWAFGVLISQRGAVALCFYSAGVRLSAAVC